MITISFDGGERIVALFARLPARLADLSPVLADIGEQQVAATRTRFLAGRSPDGSVWAPKSPATLIAQAARGDRPDPRPLFGPSRRLSSEVHYRLGPDRVEIGSSLVYAAVQQFGAAQGAFGRTRRGAPIPWGDIPARPFLGLSEDDRGAIAGILAERIEGAVSDDGPQGA